MRDFLLPESIKTMFAC